MDFYSILVTNLLIGVGLFSIYPLSMCAVSEKFYPMSSLWLVTLTLSIGCVNLWFKKKYRLLEQ